MDKKELIISIERLIGKGRQKTSRDTFLCLGILDLSKESQKESAIKLSNGGEWSIDKYRCSKCYLCKLKSDFIALDREHFPFVTKNKDDGKYDLTVDDQIHFESNLASYDEEPGISKWVYTIFRLFGISETFTECAISKEFIPRDILTKLGKFPEDGVYGKSAICDVEGTTNDFVFVFENKKFSTSSDDWITDAMKQIILYASSKIYQEKNNDVIFVFCYNGSYDIKDRTIDVMNDNPELKLLYEIFKGKSNYKFALLPSSLLFDIVKKSLKEGKKDKKWIIDKILSKVEKLPLR
jgi:hypothetical protein